MKTSIILFITIIATVLCFSCRNAGEKATEKIIENAIGEDADISINDKSVTIKTEEGTIISDTGEKEWPSEIPNDVPEFKYGKVEHISIQDMVEVKRWIMSFSGINEDAFQKYEADLKAKGFETYPTQVIENSWSITAEKEPFTIAIMAGERMATLTVSQEKE